VTTNLLYMDLWPRRVHVVAPLTSLILMVPFKKA
jgi:hypothetical protein